MLVKAYVVLKDAAAASDAMRAALRRRVAPQVPASVICEHFAALPRTETGKLQRTVCARWNAEATAPLNRKEQSCKFLQPPDWLPPRLRNGVAARKGP